MSCHSCRRLNEILLQRQLQKTRLRVDIDDVAIVWVKHLLRGMAHDSLALSY